jgi:hypothetical protein
MPKSKQNVSSGVHDLVFNHFKIKAGKLHCFFNPIHHDCKEVQRTYTQASDSLKGFFKKLTGKEQVIATEVNVRPLIGSMIRGVIIQSNKKPQFVDLVKIISLMDSPEEVCSCNNSVFSVNEVKITGGGQNARQANHDIPQE